MRTYLLFEEGVVAPLLCGLRLLIHHLSGLCDLGLFSRHASTVETRAEGGGKGEQERSNF